MNESVSESVKVTKIETIKRLLDSAEADIQGEIERTRQSWFACFQSVAWKTIPTLINTAKLMGEINNEKEADAQKYIDNLLNEIKSCSDEYHHISKPREIDSDLIPGLTEYTEGVPPNEKRVYFVDKLKGVLEVLEGK